VQPYIDRAEIKLRRVGAVLVAASLAVGLVFSWSLAYSISRLAAYARAAAEGRRGIAPKSGGPELRALAEAVETMRDRLEGRDYVERYVHTLTHEMKSPLAAIAGAAELLQGELPALKRERFAVLVAGEAERLQQLVERLLVGGAPARPGHRRAAAGIARTKTGCPQTGCRGVAGFPRAGHRPQSFADR